LPDSVNRLTEADALECPPWLIDKKTKKNIHEPIGELAGEPIPSPVARSGPANLRHGSRTPSSSDPGTSNLLLARFRRVHPPPCRIQSMHLHATVGSSALGERESEGERSEERWRARERRADPSVTCVEERIEAGSTPPLKNPRTSWWPPWATTPPPSLQGACERVAVPQLDRLVVR
jgi:hypothetical protein